MFRKNVLLLVAALCLLQCSQEYNSGIDLESIDQEVRMQDDLFRHVNGKWLKNTEIPADKSNYGSFIELIDEAEENLRSIIEEAVATTDAEEGSDLQKVGDFYRSYMDTTGIEALGLAPVQDELASIAALATRDDVVKHLGYFHRIRVQTPVSFWVNQDLKNSVEYIGYLHHAGIGLPDKDYYLNEADKFKEIREKYVAYIEQILTLGQQENAGANAALIMEMETAMAQNHWSRVENRDRDKTYNKMSVAELDKMMPAFSWSSFLDGAEFNPTEFIVRQPNYFEALDGLLKKYSVTEWKTYMTWKLLNGAASLLGADFVDASFNFYSGTLRGIEENQPRWKRAVQATNSVLGEVVGRLYVERHFKPEAKERMVELVDNLKASFADRINGLDWMSEETKEKALEKLSKFNTKIGYPDKWKDYSGLTINADELAGNYKRSSILEFERMVNKLGNPIDRTEWFMNPQMVNAYYNPPMNEIVFPAAILQPPFFNMAADDAVNYGGIGAVIGHELTHGFDDQGRKSDGDGNLNDWWTEGDAAEFQKRAAEVTAQYNTYNPIDTMHVNGELTLGENIADLGGLTIAYHAYKKSLNGVEAPLIDGYTGEQRFFMGWAQVWRRKYRDDELRNRLLTDSHSPSEYRANGVLGNMPEFYEAFDVQESDALHKPEDQRIKIW